MSASLFPLFLAHLVHQKYVCSNPALTQMLVVAMLLIEASKIWLVIKGGKKQKEECADGDGEDTYDQGRVKYTLIDKIFRRF